MKCVIGSTGVKDFAKAIHSLAKIGEDLYIEPCQSGVSFRTISSSRSAFLSYNFEHAFFTHYDSGLVGCTTTSDEDALRCKVAMKAVLNIFKGIHNLERNVQRCKLTLKWQEAKLIIQFTCHYGIVKTHNLSFIECDPLQAAYDKNSCPYHMVSESRVLLDALSSFHQQSLEEISFCFTPRNLILKSYMEEPDPTKVVHTVVTLTRGEFEDYNVDGDCELTVCLKEIRALLTFTGSVSISIKAYFSTPGSPLIFTFDSKPLYEGTLILATLVQKPEIGYQPATKPAAASKTNASTTNNTSSPRPVKIPSNHDNLPSTSTDNRADLTAIQDITPALDYSMAENAGKSQGRSQQQEEHTNDKDNSLSQAALSPVMNNHTTVQEDKDREEENNDNGDIIPLTPPSKRMKFFFKRCFESTLNPATLPGHNIILVEDSDEGE